MRYKLLTAVLIVGAFAQASLLTFTLNEDDGNLVATVSGSLNTDALNYHFNSFWGGTISPLDGQLIVGPPGAESVIVAVWDMESSDSSFGSNSAGILSDSSTGDVAGIDLARNWVMVSTSYISGSVLLGSATWNSRSFDSMGITPGTYMMNYNGGADSVVLQAVPEPATAGLLAISCSAPWLIRRMLNYYRI